MILDKVIVIVCCLAAANLLPTCAAGGAIKTAEEEATRTARNVFLPYYNNGAYYNNPWNYNYNNYHHPYRHYPNAAYSRIPIAGGGTLNPRDYQSPILYSNDVRHPDGSYFYEYETANGIRRVENSVQTGHDNVVQGSYSHVGPDGRTYTVNYIADKNGYRASGDHLPQQPQHAVSSSLSHHPIVVTTPRPIIGVKQPTAFPAFDYRHPAYVHPHNVYASPYNPFSTIRPFLAHPAPVVHPYPLGKK